MFQLYISLVEHPARLGLADGPLLAQWQPSYKRALPIQSGLAVAGALAGLIVAYLASEWRWFAASILLLANWPFTLMVIRPVNKRLMAMQIGEAGVESRALLARWGKLHNVRSALGSAATIFFACALSTAG
jgi:predicted acyltransferase